MNSEKYWPKIGHYINDNSIDKMSFKQFRSSSTNHQGIRCGGKWTTPRTPREHDLDVWTKVLGLDKTSAELATKGAPTSVKSQVVSGYNYMFTFADGSTVTVYHQSWTNTLQVTKTTPAKDQNKCLKF